eukprot:CAMPEP_0118975198 /NCGR_PEP_ID=MMETSP1173-20130426/14854_1 /TAXON_ID=1034831 /ORGANISM="Rhizochromulina marina cf, Strain CCMP1243" /LENGTH=238 /DNA_ID=CAMNT_0006925039 /DNA_START=340 /DNA_END=1056 /DNA_ORIENTATION=-
MAARRSALSKAAAWLSTPTTVQLGPRAWAKNTASLPLPQPKSKATCGRSTTSWLGCFRLSWLPVPPKDRLKPCSRTQRSRKLEGRQQAVEWDPATHSTPRQQPGTAGSSSGDTVKDGNTDQPKSSTRRWASDKSSVDDAAEAQGRLEGCWQLKDRSRSSGSGMQVDPATWPFSKASAPRTSTRGASRDGGGTSLAGGSKGALLPPPLPPDAAVNASAPSACMITNTTASTPAPNNRMY